MADNFLPQVSVILNDYGLKIAPPPAGPKVTLLGVTSNTAIPKFEPFTVSSVEKAMNALYLTTGGNTFVGELAVAIEQVANAGARNIEVVVIDHPVDAGVETYLNPKLGHYARYTALQSGYDVLRHHELDVVYPVGAYIDEDVYIANEDGVGAGHVGASGQVSFGKQLADFCYQATTESNAAVGVISAMPINYWAVRHSAYLNVEPGFDPTGSPTPDDLSPFSAEVTGFNALATFVAGMNPVLFHLPSSLLLAEWIKWHTVIATTGFSSFVYNERPASYLAFIKGSSDGTTLHGTGTSVDPVYFTNWQALDSQGALAVDSRGKKVDGGGYINVFCAPVKSSGTLLSSLRAQYNGATATSFAVDGGSSYSGFINTMAPQSATTNKAIPGLSPLRLLSKPQANDLTGARLVTMLQRSKGFVVGAGNTAAHNVSASVRSDFVYLTTMRIAQATVDLIRAVAEKYLGEPNSAPRMNALDAEIRSVLGAMTSQGALNASDFVISSTPDQRVLGILDISLTIVPAFEVRTINLTVSLAKEL